MFHSENSSLVREYANEKLVIEAWGKDSLRVRSTMRACLEDQNWALASQRERRDTRNLHPRRRVRLDHQRPDYRARRSERADHVRLTRSGEVLLQEFMRVRFGNMEKGDGQIDEAAVAYFNSALSIYPREFKPIWGGDYALDRPLRIARGGKALRDGPVSAWLPESEKLRPGIGPTQFASLSSLRVIESRLWVSLEQSGDWQSLVRKELHRMDGDYPPSSSTIGLPQATSLPRFSRTMRR